jgi:hypothetical protein
VAIRSHIIAAHRDDIAPRNLLSIARLNSARSRVRFSSCSFVRIDQTWLARSGSFARSNLPWFQGSWRGGLLDGINSLPFMIGLQVRETEQNDSPEMLIARQLWHNSCRNIVSRDGEVRTLLTLAVCTAKTNSCHSHGSESRTLIAFAKSLLQAQCRAYGTFPTLRM